MPIIVHRYTFTLVIGLLVKMRSQDVTCIAVSSKALSQSAHGPTIRWCVFHVHGDLFRELAKIEGRSLPWIGNFTNLARWTCDKRRCR